MMSAFVLAVATASVAAPPRYAASRMLKSRTLVGLQTAHAHAAFGRHRTWAIVDLESGRYDWLSLARDIVPREMASSPDGRTVVFTSYAPQANTHLLYLWDRDPNHPPVSIGDSRGYHANPAFDSDGEWVYFAHNPEADGMPMQHAARAYAQIYRVRPNGTELSPLTAERGCHFSPAASRKGKLNFVHTNCHGFAHSWVQMEIGTRSQSERELLGEATEFDLTPDEKTAVYVVPRGPISYLFRYDAASRHSSLIDQGISPSRVEPRLGSRGDLFYVLNDCLWRRRRGQKTNILRLSEGPR